MHFFSTITTMNIVGLVLLAIGAVINFATNKIAKLIKSDKIYVPIIIKTIGLVLVIFAFLMIIGVIA
ncbi:MAG: hypothetical protein WCP73_03695 [Eubacteriales bacterium]